MSEKIDDTSRAILRELQRDASQSLDAIAETVGVSLNTCWRRVQALEAAEVIQKRVAILDPDKVGKPMTVFVAVHTDQHSREWSDRFTSAMDSLPEIVEIYRLAGTIDYLLKIVVADVAEYDRVYKALTAKVAISDVTAMFAMETIRNETALPL